MHIDVPLNRLKFGQEDGAGINARVVGRLDGIEALAANILPIIPRTGRIVPSSPSSPKITDWGITSPALICPLLHKIAAAILRSKLLPSVT